MDKLYSQNNKRGFTLVELMVSISIFIIITSVTLVNYPRFSNKLSLDLLAEDVALSVRQAQVFGASVLGTKTVGQNSTKAFKAYGIHFEAPLPNAATYKYLIFADINGDRIYDGPDANRPIPFSCPHIETGNVSSPINGEECVQNFQITGWNQARSLCSNFIDKDHPEDQTSDERVVQCSDDTKQISSLDIAFVRPNLDAKFAIKVNGQAVSSDNISNVGIIFESPGGDYKKTVVIWKTGQISVE
jgi:prepilin-type N-terminal cleavage/methylation domain-containing protein